MSDRSPDRLDNGVSTRDAIQKLPHGAAIPSRVDLGQGPEVAFFLRLASSRVGEGGDVGITTVRTMCDVINEVAVIPIMLQGEADDLVAEPYEMWLNVHGAGGTNQRILESLAAQDRVVLVEVGDRGDSHPLKIRNLMQPSFAAMLDLVRPLKPWTMAEFDAARELLYRQHPTPKDLWDVLGTAPTVQDPRLPPA